MAGPNPHPEQLQKPGDYRLGTALVVGSSGLQINIKHLITELSIFQDINRPFMSGNMIIQDGRGIYELLPFLGQERLLLELWTPGANYKIDFVTYTAWIYNIQDRFPSSDRAQTYMIQFTSNENYKNLRTKISHSFTGTIANIVSEIMKDDTFLGTKKSVTIDPTLGNKKYIAPNLRPFSIIKNLKEEAINEKGEPYFVFYEDPLGFHFRSLDSLVGVEGETSVPHKRTFSSQVPDDPSNIGDQMSLLLNYHVDDSCNTLINTAAGMFCSSLTVHDIFNKQVNKFEFNYMTDSYNVRNSTNQGNGNSGPIVSMIPIDPYGNKITDFPDSKQYLHSTSSAFIHNEGTDSSPEYSYTDNNALSWMMENRSREMELDYFTLDIMMYGDTNLMVGNMINLIIPSNKIQSKSGGKSSIDPILSGRYLITSLRHKVLMSEGTHTMHCKVMKDSVVEAIAETETVWDAEPEGNIVIAKEEQEIRSVGFVDRHRPLHAGTIANPDVGKPS